MECWKVALPQTVAGRGTTYWIDLLSAKHENDATRKFAVRELFLITAEAGCTSPAAPAVHDMKTDDGRRSKPEGFLAMLSRGETIYQ
jgi:hypothetical protein